MNLWTVLLESDSCSDYLERRDILLKKAEKAEIISEVRERFTKAKVAVLTDYRGLDVEKMTELRVKLRGAKADYKVMKNTLASKAAEGTPMEGLKEHFSGPVGVAISYDDSLSMLKVLTEFAKKEDKLKIKAGLVENKIADLNELKMLAALPSKDVLLAKFMGSLKSPIYGLAGSLNGIIMKFAYALNAVKEQKAKAG
jgi:large subunit ribosomal protein L10